MNAIWTILLAVYMAARLTAQGGIVAPAAPPASGHIQMAQAQATMAPTTTTLASAPSAPLPPCPQACPCEVQQQPCGNVAPWSWQHDNQNDDEWPADHGG
jgi:hypothetical protein